MMFKDEMRSDELYHVITCKISGMKTLRNVVSVVCETALRVMVIESMRICSRLVLCRSSDDHNLQASWIIIRRQATLENIKARHQCSHLVGFG